MEVKGPEAAVGETGGLVGELPVWEKRGAAVGGMVVGEEAQAWVGSLVAAALAVAAAAAMSAAAKVAAAMDWVVIRVAREAKAVAVAGRDTRCAVVQHGRWEHPSGF